MHNETKLRSAVRTICFPGITVGIDENGDSLLFRSADYDNRGLVRGMVVHISRGAAGFHANGFKYADDTARRWGVGVGARSLRQIDIDSAAAVEFLGVC